LPRRSTVLITFALLACVPVLQALYYSPRLPETVASHFRADGQPDDWMQRRGFVIGSLVLVESLIGFFALLAVVMPRMVPTPPASAPLTPEQRERADAVHGRLRAGISWFAFWFGLATCGFLLLVGQFAYAANLRDPARFPPMLPLLGPYLAVSALLALRLVRIERRLSREFPREPLPDNIWFPAKRYGWGWGPPVRWQGWAVIAGWLAAFGTGVILVTRSGLEPAIVVALLLVFSLLWSGVLLAICWAKGETPRWRWGD
jgi:hypothetical protein